MYCYGKCSVAYQKKAWSPGQSWGVGRTNLLYVALFEYIVQVIYVEATYVCETANQLITL